MADSAFEPVPNFSTGHYHHPNVSLALNTTGALENSEEHLNSPSNALTESPHDPSTFDQENSVSTPQPPHPFAEPESFVSESQGGISYPMPHTEIPFSSSNVVEPVTDGDSDTIFSSGNISQAAVHGSSAEGHVPSSRLPLQRSLGTLSCLTIFGGSVLTLLAVSFLIFLWAGGGPVQGGTEATRTWRNIMLHGWATQAVTLTSLLIRVISAAQAGLCTSLVSALLLERHGVPISKVVQLSVTRSVNVGPMEFLYMIASRKTRKVALKQEVLLLFILAATAFGIQFSSTILISDFGTTRLVRDSNQTIMNVAMSPMSLQKPGPLSTFGDVDTATVLFGEVDSQADPAPNQLGVSDTGLKRRAFLPFEKEDRVGLQYFSGPAFSLLSRAACIRPSMTARLMFYEGWPFIEGSINYNQSLGNAGQEPTQRCYTTQTDTVYCLPTTFNCTLPGSYNTLPSPQWTTAICHLRINQDTGDDSMPGWDQYGSIFNFPSGSWPHLVFATNIPTSYWPQIQQSGPVMLDKPASYGEWVTHEILDPGNLLNTTFCFSTIYTTVSSLTMTGNINQTEPGLSWNTTAGSPEVGSIQTLFGADRIHKTPAERGILSIIGDIQDPASPSTFNITNTSAQAAVDFSAISFGGGAAAGVWENIGNGSVSLCDHCDILGFSVPDDVAGLFQGIIDSTGRAAVAIDTYLTILSRLWYYYLFPRFDVPGYVDVAFVAEVVLPLRWRGLTAVLVLIGVNTIVMFIIAAMYVWRTRFSLTGNYWHAVAQLISKDTVTLFEKSGEMKDEDVTEQLDLESEDFLVKIERSDRDGLVTVVRV